MPGTKPDIRTRIIGRIVHLCGIIPIIACAQIPEPPVAPVRLVTNNYYGTEVVDPYRWMEDAGSVEYQNWMKQQSDFARLKLDSLPLRAKLLTELHQLDSTLDTFPGALNLVGNRLFYMRTPPPSSEYQVFMREGWSGREKLVFDPAKMATPDGKPLRLNFYHAAPDGRHVVCRVSQGGSEDTTLEIIEVDGGRIVDKSIDHAAFGNVNWHPNGSAFFYAGRPKPSGDTTNSSTERVFVHFLGSDPAQDRALLGRDVSSTILLTGNQSASINTSWNSDYMFAEVHDGVDPNIEIYVAPLVNKNTAEIKWRKACAFSDEVTGCSLDGRNLILLSRKNAPHGKLQQVSCDHLSSPLPVMAESKSSLSAPVVAKDGLYISFSDGIASHLLRVPQGDWNKADEISLPVIGSIARILHDPRRPGVLLSLNSCTEPTGYYSFDPLTPRFTKVPLGGTGTPSLASLEAHRVEAVSRDGTRVPLTIIHRKGLTLDGNRPTLLFGYGAYGIGQEPSFDLNREPWFARGGVYAVAHVRGGGELGQEWYLAGKGKNKQNGVEDFIACAKYLVDHHYTSAEKLAAQSVSAGGVLIGQAVMQHPELFGAAVIEVGALDALRFEVTPNGPPNFPEWGNTQTQEGFEILRALSPYEHVTPGTRYPAMLLTTGINDHRVEPWQSAKMTARLQAANIGEKPILLCVNYDDGHFQSSVASILEHQADIWAFLLWQLGETK